MTRHEAIKIVRDVFVNGPGNCETRMVETFEKLGMLKLDEPKSAPQDKIKALAKELSNVASGCTCFDCLTKTLDRHGLRIVEK